MSVPKKYSKLDTYSSSFNVTVLLIFRYKITSSWYFTNYTQKSIEI